MRSLAAYRAVVVPLLRPAQLMVRSLRSMFRRTMEAQAMTEGERMVWSAAWAQRGEAVRRRHPEEGRLTRTTECGIL